MLLRPRLIVLGRDGRPFTGRRRDRLVHTAEIGDRRPESECTLLVHPTDARPLKTLLEAARREEWRQKLSELLSDQTPADLKKLLDDADPLDIQAQLTPSMLQQLSLPPTLAQAIAEIASRPTVFGVESPERSAGLDARNEHRKPALPGLFESIGRELANDRGLLDYGRLAFAPVGELGRDRHRFLDLLGRLQAQLTTEARLNMAIKEGPILLAGQTGSGKTEMATSLHQAMLQSTGRRGAFVSINVAAIQPSLLESRMRGYLQGMYTDAKKDHPGWFERADNGTLFLDEFQSAPSEVQLQLLDLMRAVSDTVHVARIGEEDKPRTCRVRLILAINEPVESLIASKRLRQDVLFRIRHRMDVSPLSARLRREAELLDRLWCLNRWRSNAAIELDASGMLQDDPKGDDPARAIYAALAPDLPNDARARLLTHDWPGNLREFERVCFDVLWEYDLTGSIAARDWLEIVDRAIGNVAPRSAAPDVGAAALKRLRHAEQVLKAHGFKVRPSQPELEGLKLKSPKTLKGFLRQHRGHLTLPEWATNPRARRLLAD